MAQIVVCNNYEVLSAFISEKVSDYTVHCVETEYGSKVAHGNGVNLNHHGALSYNRAPCLQNNLMGFGTQENILCLSHLDLDSIAGALAILGIKPEFDRCFWAEAEHIDNNGPHHIRQYEEYFAMWWSWQQKNREPRINAEIQDVTNYIFDCLERLKIIEHIYQGGYELDKHKAAWEEAEEFLDKEFQLGLDSFQESIVCKTAVKDFHILVRKSDQIVNHLYRHGEKVADIVIALNTKFNSITISFESNFNEFLTKDCRQIMQSYQGWKCDPSLAGGKDVIAGSPREVKYDGNDLKIFVEWFLLTFNEWVR